MIGFEPSLFASELEPHKTYTLSWKHKPYFGSTLSRCRFDSHCMLWPFMLSVSGTSVCNDPIIAFMSLCCRQHFFSAVLRPYRLSSCGRLVARSATYQGV